jgi:hypothetical protein
VRAVGRGSIYARDQFRGFGLDRRQGRFSLALGDDVDEADKRSDNDKSGSSLPQGTGLRGLGHLLTTALDRSETIQRHLADYLNAPPELAHWLERWQADG